MISQDTTQDIESSVEEPDTESESKKRHEEIVHAARNRFKKAEESWAEIVQAAKEDLAFAAGDQWDPQVKQARSVDRRPILTINRVLGSIHQITNEERQSRPSIKVSPVDDNADIETAKIYQGLIRHIEYSSNADTAYDTACDSQVRAGYGFFRIVTDYCDPLSFDQEIKIKRVPDRFSVYLDPNFSEPDGSDAEWGIAFEDMPKETFKRLYPNAKLTTYQDWGPLLKQCDGWVQKSTARVAEYFYKEYKKEKAYLLSFEGVKQSFSHAELEEKLKDTGFAVESLPPGMEIIDVRDTLIPVVKWCKTNGIEVLEETDWPGRWIPIIPVLGEEQILDGKRTLSGIVRNAKDPQRMYNYWATAETETIALAPKAPWIAAEGQLEGHEAAWKNSNTANQAVLTYKPTSVNGQPLPPPTRNVFEPPVQAISQARMLASDDLKASTSIYDASLGNRSNESSGVAIQRRSAQSATANFHFIDNLAKSIRHAGRIIVDLIPHIYDTERAVRILGEDGAEEIVKINAEFERNGERAHYQFGVGKYDVTVSTGPSYETKRQEAVQAMLEFTRAMPQHAGIISDLLVKNMDWPGASEISERLRKTLPPGIAESGKKQIPPEAQAQIEQMGMMIEQITQELNAAKEDIRTKRLELESKERIEMAKLENQVLLETFKASPQDTILSLQQQLAELQARQEELWAMSTGQQQSQDLNAGAMAQANENQDQPTDGQSSGQFMGE